MRKINYNEKFEIFLKFYLNYYIVHTAQLCGLPKVKIIKRLLELQDQ